VTSFSEAGVVLVIADESDVVIARNLAREVAGIQGLSDSVTESLAIAVSEIARKALDHARGGRMRIATQSRDGRRGVAVIIDDDGPGIRDIETAMTDGYSSGNGLGLGLAGARRLVHDFDIVSRIGSGTTVSMCCWAPADASWPDGRR
jgi:serine/threonine-protein kinase RsbT